MEPPENGAAPAGDQGDALKHAAEGEGYAWPERAQVCDHASTITGRMPASHVHFAAERCAACGVFIRWLPKTETLERRRLNPFRLARLAMCSSLSAWERSFVRDVSQQRKLSPRQQKIVDRLCATHLETKAP